MHIVTCQVGGSLRLGEGARIVIHGRQGARIALGAAAPAGTDLILGGAAIQPVSGKDGVWHYLFSLYGSRRFQLGGYDIRFWIPGELIALAEGCSDWLHVGIGSRTPDAPPEYRPPVPLKRAAPVSAGCVLPLIHAAEHRPHSVGEA